MKLDVTYKFNAPVEEVERILFDERLVPLLKERMPTLLDIKPISRKLEGSVLSRDVRYFPKPIINSVAGKKVEPEWMVFTEVTKFDFATHKGTFQNVPTHHKIAGLLVNQGELSLRSTGPNSCEQNVKTEIKVKVPILGMIAEKVIGTNAEKMLAELAEVVRGVLQSGEMPRV